MISSLQTPCCQGIWWHGSCEYIEITLCQYLLILLPCHLCLSSYWCSYVCRRINSLSSEQPAPSLVWDFCSNTNSAEVFPLLFVSSTFCCSHWFFFSCTSKTDQLMVFMIVMQEMDVQSPKRALISAAFTFKQLILNYFLCFFTLNYVQKVLKFVQTFLLSRSLTKEIVEMLTGKLFVNSLTGQ